MNKTESQTEAKTKYVPLTFVEDVLKFCDLNERQKRLFFGCVAKAYGHGGISTLSRIACANAESIRRGVLEVKGKLELPEQGRIRDFGGGRPPLTAKYPNLERDLRKILRDHTYGNPEDLLVYTNLSARKIKALLEQQGYEISHTTVLSLIENEGYSKQGNRKLIQVGEPHPDRDAQFQYINKKGAEWLENGLSMISVDCKKKENIGNFSNPGKEYRPKGCPRETLDHDFLNQELGKVAPYGVYLVNDNSAFINLGTSADTAEFAGESIRQWWLRFGRCNFQDNKKLFIVCDNGGSNGSRNRLWKLSLAYLADEFGLEIHVSHLPPGTSKWNKIEHRVFCFISQSWGAKPLDSIETVVKLIRSTTTSTGLKVDCDVDTNVYRTGIKVSKEQLESIDMEGLGEFPNWNYIIRGFKK